MHPALGPADWWTEPLPVAKMDAERLASLLEGFSSDIVLGIFARK